MTELGTTGSVYHQQSGQRMLLAGALSCIMHFAFLYGVPVTERGASLSAGSSLQVRLQAGMRAVQADAVRELAAPQLAAESVTPVTPQEARTETLLPSAPQAQASAAQSPATPGLELPLAPDPTYYPARLLDIYPQPLTPVVIGYPETAQAAQLDGRVVLLLLIDEYGAVTDSSVVEADPAGYFEDAAHQVFRVVRFVPGMRHGRAVKCRVLVQVRYSYGERQGSMQ